MDILEKIELNKLIKAYDGDNTFIISLQKQLKNNKYLQKVEHGKKMIKVFTDKQYLTAKTLLK